jgi:apolipoprotein D and lipocalin family protein
MKSTVLLPILIFGVYACTTVPKHVTPVKSFDKERYLGKWYEIARFDFRFERNLNNTTAEYTLQENGKIKVKNSGFDTTKQAWSEVTGKAKFVGDETVAMLKVSFFGPFYAGYNVIAIDDNYQYALVAGKNLDYLWILSRTTTIPDDIKAKYIEMAKNYGFDTSRFIWVAHDKASNKHQ